MRAACSGCTAARRRELEGGRTAAAAVMAARSGCSLLVARRWREAGQVAWQCSGGRDYGLQQQQLQRQYLHSSCTGRLISQRLL